MRSPIPRVRARRAPMSRAFAIKTLQQELLKVECAVDATVRDLKQAMCTPPREGWRTAEHIKLCCNGRVLDNSEALTAAAEFLDGGENRFLVAIVTRASTMHTRTKQDVD